MESRFAERARLIRQILHPDQEGGRPAGGSADEGSREPKDVPLSATQERRPRNEEGTTREGQRSRAPGGERGEQADEGKTE